MMARPPSVQATGVTVRFGELVALDDVAISLDRGVTALLGENGAGKTTLMRVLATLLQPDTGELHIEGVTVSRRAETAAYRRSIGYLPQKVPAVKHLTVQQYLEYLAFLKGMARKTAVAEVAHALALVDLTEKRSSRTTSLSGGMRRRLGLAAAVLGYPKMLLFDEPTVGLDPVQRIEVRDLVKRCAEKCPVLLSTHLSEDVVAVADDVVVLHHGRVVFDDTLAVLATHAGVGAPGVNDVERAFLSVIGGAAL